MHNEGTLLFIYAETALHVGAGRGLDAIDLPLVRERMSDLPTVPGSGIKGALREELDPDRKPQGDAEVLALFGPPPPDPAEQAKARQEDREKGGQGKSSAPEYAGALSLTDARLLLFPVRSVRGGWAWLTCPMALQRLARDLGVLRPADRPPSWAGLDPEEKQEIQALVTTGSRVVEASQGSPALLVEDLEFAAKVDPRVDTLAAWLGQALPATAGYHPFRTRLRQQLVVVGDTDFGDLTRQCTEVATRVKIDPKTGTVMKGGLWTEEALPAETLLWSLALLSDSRHAQHQKQQDDDANQFPAATALKKLFTLTKNLHRLRLGGDRSVGRGLAGLRLWNGVVPVDQEGGR